VKADAREPAIRKEPHPRVVDRIGLHGQAIAARHHAGIIAWANAEPQECFGLPSAPYP